jgi:hypothetical protein
MPLIETFGGDSARGYGENAKSPFVYTTDLNATLTTYSGFGGPYNIVTWRYVSGTFTIKSGKKTFDVLLVGGGGGGGAGAYWGTPNQNGLSWGYAGGSGGGGGGTYTTTVTLGPGTYTASPGTPGSAGFLYYVGSPGAYYYVIPSAGAASTFNGLSANGGQPGYNGQQGGGYVPGGTSGNGYAGGSSAGSGDGGGGGAAGAGSRADGITGYGFYTGGSGLFSQFTSNGGNYYGIGGTSPNLAFTYSAGASAPTAVNAGYALSTGIGDGGPGAFSVGSNVNGQSSANSPGYGAVMIRWRP